MSESRGLVSAPCNWAGVSPMWKIYDCSMRVLRGYVLPVFFALLFFYLTPVYGIDVNLAWDPNTESNLAGYNVYFGTASRSYGSPINVGNRTTYTVTGLSGTVFYFAVTAVDTSGVESGFSSEVVVSLLCTFSISPASLTIGQGASTGSVAVSASTGCNWAATSNASWITITSGSAGAGDGTVNYSLAVNSTGIARTGTITIAGQNFTVIQAGIACTYAISSTTQSFGTGGGTGNVSVTSTSGCNWTAVSNVGWLNISFGGIGIGNGTVSYSVSPNLTISSRSGTLTIAGQTFTVTQAGLSCTYSISPATQSINLSGGGGSVTITTATGCDWTSASNASWITITSAGTGTGTGNLNYLVEANTTGSSRNGTMTIAGQTFVVTQDVPVCSFSISPTTRAFSESPATGSVAVTGTSGCTWAASSNASWLRITTVIFGSNGIVNYSVAANTGGARTGTLTIDGQTYTVTQSGSCSYGISPTSQSFTADTGSGSVAVTAATGCSWAAISNDSWLTITSGGSGSGNGTVSYSVAANTTTGPRTGTLLVAGQTLTVTQEVPPCTYSISPTSLSSGEGAATGSVAVTSPGGCSWTAASNAPWLTISSGGSGTGNGTVSYSLAANTTTGSRTGILTVAGQTFTVTQAGAGCTYSISSASQSFTEGAGSGTVVLTATAGCTWIATSNATWLTISSGGSGTGNGIIGYSVAANGTSSSRTGTLTIAGQTFTVTQAAAGCAFSISSSDQSFDLRGGTGTVLVTATSGCFWAALSNEPWLTITSPQTASGNGMVSYSVAANTTAGRRIGTLTIAGQTFTVTQSDVGCVTSILPVSRHFDDGGGTGSVSVDAAGGCSWTPSSNVSWITILFMELPNGVAGGSGSINFSVAANTTSEFRTGTVRIEGLTFTVNQAGVGCSSSISPTAQTFDQSGGGGSLALTVTGPCGATAQSSANWISLTSVVLPGSSSGGTGVIRFTVAPNPSFDSRTGTVTIAGRTLTISQAGTGCIFSVFPDSQSFNRSAGTGTVSVIAAPGCSWTASSGVGWITITSGDSGTGDGIVSYAVEAAGTLSFRSGVLTVAGQNLTVTQTSTHTTSFSQFANGEDWTSSLVLTNPSPTQVATGSATFYNSAGNAVALSINGRAPATSVSFSIEPLGGATFRTDGSGGLISGSIQISANSPVSGVVKYSHRTLGLTGVGESIPLRSLMTFVVMDTNRGISTGIALTNPQSGTAQITLSLRGLDGKEVPGGAASLSIPSNAQVSKFVSEFFPAANTANFQGTLIVTATGLGNNVTATPIQIGTLSGQFTVLPVVPVDPAQNTRLLYFAQFVNGGGWTSSLYIVNPSSSLSGSITSFLDGEGNLLDISGPRGTILDTVIEPLGGAVLQTNGQGPQNAGSARLISSHPVGGVLLFSSPNVGTAAVSPSMPMTSFITPVARDANGSTGVAIASVGAPVTVFLELMNQRGEPVQGGQFTLDLPANGQVARYLEQLFPDADISNFEGTLSVSAEGGSIVGTALLIGTTKDQIAALPVTAIR